MPHSHPVIAIKDFPAAGMLLTMLGGWHVLVLRVDGAYYALNNRCTHAAAPLSGGRLRRDTIICPLHGSRFEVRSGRCVGDAHAPIRSFPVEIINGEICVTVPSHPPSHDEIPVAMK